MGTLISLGSGANAQDLRWATRSGGISYEEGSGIATTPLGESYVTGRFNATAVFGPGEPNQTLLTSAGAADIFVAKYDRDGALVWVRRVGGTSLDDGRGIATTPRGESYVTGSFANTVTFGPGEPNQTTLTSAGASDIFVAKYDGDGALLWARRAAAPTSALAKASRRRRGARAT